MSITDFFPSFDFRIRFVLNGDMFVLGLKLSQARHASFEQIMISFCV